jgi:hypothetical protein
LKAASTVQAALAMPGLEATTPAVQVPEASESAAPVSEVPVSETPIPAVPPVPQNRFRMK